LCTKIRVTKREKAIKMQLAIRAIVLMEVGIEAA
jgi:hypothetical protein